MLFTVSSSYTIRTLKV